MALVLTVALAILYPFPFLLINTAKKHMMFFRYLVAKQYFLDQSGWFAATKTVLIVLFFLAFGFLSLKFVNSKRAVYVPASFTVVVSLIAFLLNPFSIITYYLLLIVCLLANVLSAAAIIMEKKFVTNQC